MSQFEVHTKETAPTESANLLTAAEKGYGFVPNLLGAVALVSCITIGSTAKTAGLVAAILIVLKAWVDYANASASLLGGT